MKRKTWIVSSAFSIPIAVLFLWTLKLSLNRSQGIAVELPIKGFDPRDKLSGHYLRFRLDLAAEDPCPTANNMPLKDEIPRCLCIKPTKPLAQITWKGVCETKPVDCSLFIRGQCEWQGFVAGIERYYIPEADSSFIPRLPDHSTLVISVQASGITLPLELKPGGTNYQEWIEARKKTSAAGVAP